MRIQGFPISFNTDSVNLGGFVEVIRSSAVDRLLRNPQLEDVALKNRDSNMPLGRRSAGSLWVLKESRGLWTEIDADAENTYVSDLLRAIKRGDARDGSFEFQTFDDVWTLRDGVPFREVLDMSIRAISGGVSFPAHEKTMMSVTDDEND